MNPIQSEEARNATIEKLSAFAIEHEAISVPVAVWVIDYIAIQESTITTQSAALKTAVEVLEIVENQFQVDKIMTTIDHNGDWMEIETGETVCPACGGNGDDRPLEHENGCFIPGIQAALTACREALKGEPT